MWNPDRIFIIAMTIFFIGSIYVLSLIPKE